MRQTAHPCGLLTLHKHKARVREGFRQQRPYIIAHKWDVRERLGSKEFGRWLGCIQTPSGCHPEGDI